MATTMVDRSELRRHYVQVLPVHVQDLEAVPACELHVLRGSSLFRSDAHLWMNWGLMSRSN